MTGETKLRKLAAGMEPQLHEGEYVFSRVPAAQGIPPGLDVAGTFREDEGITLILRREEAERSELAFAYVCRRITLRVHSSLEAVGFLALIAERLAQRGISANVVSAFYHDHLFVPSDRAEEAFEALAALSREYQNLLSPPA